MKVIDVTCPRCDAGVGVPCAKIGELVSYVSGPGFHMERWYAAEKVLAEGKGGGPGQGCTGCQ